MRNEDEGRSARSASSFTANRERDWKNRGNRGDRGEEAAPAREVNKGNAGRSGDKATGGRTQLENMDVFRLAHELALRTHQVTSRFPAEERGSLVALLRRASAAVPAQLAAGWSRWDRNEYNAAVTSARDAAAETRYFLLLTKDLGHLPEQECDDMRDGYERIAKMLTRLAQAWLERAR